MDIRELSERTTVYEKVEIQAEPIEWSRAAIVVAYRTQAGEWSHHQGAGNEVVGYIHPCNEWRVLDANRLPVEFFNHQLMDYDPHSEASVRQFVRDWGFPFLPQRNLSDDDAGWEYRGAKRVNAAMEATRSVHDLALVLDAMWFDEYDRRTGQGRYEARCSSEADDSNVDDFEKYAEPRYGERVPVGSEADFFKSMSDDTPESDAISFAEASLTLEILQVAVLNIRHCIRHNGSIYLRHLDVFNIGGSNPHMIQYGDVHSGVVTAQQSYSMLTAAICNQVIDAFVDPAPWRDCACEGCDVLFKRKQSKARMPTSDSAYCCSACEERQKKRNQRASAKSRILH